MIDIPARKKKSEEMQLEIVIKCSTFRDHRKEEYNIRIFHIDKAH